MKHILLSICITIFGCLWLIDAYGQDPQFSQIYSAPLYLNPAFAGNLDFDCKKMPESRFKTNLNYRNQYNGSFNTLSATIDYREKTGKMGFGFLVLRDRIGDVPLSNTTLGFIGSYKIPLQNDWNLHTGLQGNFNFRTTNFNNYTFPDQFAITGAPGVSRPTQEPLLRGEETAFIDFAGGVLLFNEFYYIGGAAHHINQPNQSLLNGVDRLPMKVSLHTGYKFPLKRSKTMRKRGLDKSVTPTLHYKNQGPFQQMDVGAFFNYDPLVLGMWYRGLPIFTAPDNKSRQQDGLVFLAGVKTATDYGLFRFGFSYDVPVTKAFNFGRIFEISLQYQIINEKCRKRKIYKSMPCPSL
jgi:type IX secretion system PorP/SprF family membrane protein